MKNNFLFIRHTLDLIVAHGVHDRSFLRGQQHLSARRRSMLNLRSVSWWHV